MIVAPLFFLLGVKKVDWIVPYLPYVAVFIALTHAKLAWKKYKDGEQLLESKSESKSE